MGLTGTQKFAYKLFGKRAAKSKELPKIKSDLIRAHQTIRAEVHLAFAMMIGVFTGIISLIFLGIGLPFLFSTVGIPGIMNAFIPLLALIFGYSGYVLVYADPGSKAKSRAKKIDNKLPYATNYITAMASAGVVPANIFESLSLQGDIYGEVSDEAAWMYKDLHVHGIDILTALRRAIHRSPSTKFQELLQGIITTITSGGNLTNYLEQKAARYQWENRIEQKAFIETMGLMAETYVTAAVAGPLFLIVIVAIIVLMGSGTMMHLQLLVYLLLPIINIGFLFGLKSMIPEV